MKEYKIGDIRNGYSVLPKEERPKILLLADDLRMASGVATMSKEFVLGMCHRFQIIEVGAAVNHPDHGKILDVSADVQLQTGVPDVSIRILAWNGYGEPDLIRQLLTVEQPAAILHFTDPRYWQWLYEMEHEIRQNCPILYYNIWDGGSAVGTDVGVADPHYNGTYYASCDSLFAISKQTYGINNRVIKGVFDDEFDIKLSKNTL